MKGLDAPSESDAAIEPGAADATGIRVERARHAFRGIELELVCSCGRAFSGLPPTVAGLAFARVRCPDCHACHEIGPEQLDAAVAASLSERSFEELRTLTETASMATEGWYASATIRTALESRGIELGPPLERELQPLFMHALLEREQGGEP